MYIVVLNKYIWQMFVKLQQSVKCFTLFFCLLSSIIQMKILNIQFKAFNILKEHDIIYRVIHFKTILLKVLSHHL